MEKSSWRVQFKENWKATWPIQIINIVLTCLIIINIAIFGYLDRTIENLNLFSTFTGILIGLSMITNGLNFIMYKEHYTQMAIKYAKPNNVITQYFWVGLIIFGTIIIILAMFFHFIN